MQLDDRSLSSQKSHFQQNESDLQLLSRGDQGEQPDGEFLASFEPNR